MRKIECEDCGYEIYKDDAIEIDGKFYCNDCAIICYDCGEAILLDDATGVGESYVCEDCLESNYFKCDDCGEYHSKNEYSYYIDSEDMTVCENCWDNGDYGQCSNCGYSMRSDDLHWSDSNEEYYCDDCYTDLDDDRLFEYHSDEGRGDESEDSQLRVGIEIEKEDEDFLDGFEKYGFLDKTGWVVESDSSLGYGGFEAVSPIYPLQITKLRKIFKQKELIDVACASHTSNCGGHITISDKTRTPYEIIDDIAGYLPILYAMFPHRVYRNYCLAQKKDNYKRESHYALSCRGCYKGDGLEVRLFDSPKNTEDILNRFKLLKYMLEHEARVDDKAFKVLSDSLTLRKIIKAHLDLYKMDYNQFYKDIGKYARDVEGKHIIRKVRKINKISNTTL